MTHGSTGGPVPSIHKDMLAKIMQSPAESLLASAAIYQERGEYFSADLCRTMARDCTDIGPMGDALYRNWANQQAVRIAAKMGEA